MAALMVVGILEAVCHAGPPVVVEFDLREGGVSLVLSGESAVLHPWLDLPVELDPADSAARERLSAAILAGFQTRYQLRLDGERAELEVVSITQADELAFGGEIGTRLELFVARETLPRRVDLVWRASFGSEWAGDPMPVMFRCLGRYEWRTISEKEPECSWHARRRERQQAGFPELPEVLPPSPRSPLSIPLLSLVLGAAAAGLLWRRFGWAGAHSVTPEGAALSQTSRPWVARGAGSLALLILAWALRDTAALEFERGPEPASLPDSARALELFESLHRNIYAALSAETEDEVYARLARSFDAAILDEQYLEVFQSLVMREQGGAVCTVERIDVQERKVDFLRKPPEPFEGSTLLSFWTEWKWRVMGQVVHYGHRHRRMNQYHARYWLRHDGEAWKIAQVEELDHLRVDDDEEEWAQLVGEDAALSSAAEEGS